jgi:small subunit ribosomal protein MRP21
MDIHIETSPSHFPSQCHCIEFHVYTMEFLRATEALLRSSQPLLPFLAPRVASTSRIGGLSRCHQLRQNQISRTFSTSHSRRQQAATASNLRDEEEEDDMPKTENGELDFDALLNKTMNPGTKGVPTATTGRSSHFSSAYAQQAKRPDYSLSAMDGKSSSDDLWNQFRAKPPRISTRPGPKLEPLDIAGLTGSMQSTKPINQTTSSTFDRPRDPPPTPMPAPMKLGPTVGRTIQVQEERGIDVGRAFRMLEQRVAREKVRKHSQAQKFYERPGLKRKRLRSERWKRRFKAAFQETVRRVGELRGMGW